MVEFKTPVLLLVSSKNSCGRETVCGCSQNVRYIKQLLSQRYIPRQKPLRYTANTCENWRYSQSRFLVPPFCMFRRILRTFVNAQDPTVSIPLNNPPLSKAPLCESGRSLLRAKKSNSIDLNLQITSHSITPEKKLRFLLCMDNCSIK